MNTYSFETTLYTPVSNQEIYWKNNESQHFFNGVISLGIECENELKEEQRRKRVQIVYENVKNLHAALLSQNGMKCLNAWLLK